MADDLDAQFQQAAVDVQGLPTDPGNAVKLTLYALYKQATAGDASGAKRPGLTDFVGRAKYDAWAKVAGLGPEDAKRAYVAEVRGLLEN